MLYIVSLLHDVSLIKLQSSLFVGIHIEKFLRKILRARNLLFLSCNDKSMIHRESNFHASSDMYYDIFEKILASLSCISSSIYLHVVTTTPTLIPRWRWKICCPLTGICLPRVYPCLLFCSLLFATPLSSVRSRSIRISLPSHSRARNLVDAPI